MVKNKIRVVGAVIVRGKKILAARRGPGKTLAGLWEFPGGKIDPRETPTAALAREVREELLCDVEIGRQITTTTHEYDFGIVILTTFYAALLETEPQLTEHSELKWVPASDLESLAWTPADIPAIHQIVADFSGQD